MILQMGHGLAPRLSSTRQHFIDFCLASGRVLQIEIEFSCLSQFFNITEAVFTKHSLKFLKTKIFERKIGYILLPIHLYWEF